jgi:hypothetical protein
MKTREFEIIIIILVLLCLSAVCALEAIERGWVAF